MWKGVNCEEVRERSECLAFEVACSCGYRSKRRGEFDGWGVRGLLLSVFYGGVLLSSSRITCLLKSPGLEEKPELLAKANVFVSEAPGQE